jgi:hypothetical protein
MDNAELINTVEIEAESLRLNQEIEASTLYSKQLQQLLPRSAEIIGLLQAGTFISSSGHIKLHKELSRHTHAYQVLMEMTGNTLVHHHVGFFHLQPLETRSLNLRERQIAAAMFALVEWLSDQGRSVESMINAEDPISMNDLTLLVEHHRERLQPLGLGTVDDYLANGIKKLVEAGVMQTHTDAMNQQTYTLGIPTYYYLDITRKLAKQKESQAAQQDVAVIDIDAAAEDMLESLDEEL